MDEPAGDHPVIAPLETWNDTTRYVAIVRRVVGGIVSNEATGVVTGMPETIAYDIDVNMGNGRVQKYKSKKPHNDRGEVEIRAAKVGTICEAFRFGGEMYFDIPERENFGDCE